jgi:hypothetical protein
MSIWKSQEIVSVSGAGLGETSSTAYRGDRGKTAYDHSQSRTSVHGITVATDKTLSVTDNATLSGTNTGDKIKANTDAAASTNVGALRYITTATSSALEMVMQTGDDTYAWVEIKANDWS